MNTALFRKRDIKQHTAATRITRPKKQGHFRSEKSHKHSEALDCEEIDEEVGSYVEVKK